MDNSVGDVAKPFPCLACTSRFTRQENLNRHTASVHRKSNLRPFSCPQCEVSFSRSDLRKRHVRKCHPHPGAAEQNAPSETASFAKTPGETHRVEPGASRISDACQMHVPLSPVSVPSGQTSRPDGDDSGSISYAFSAQNMSWLFKLPQFITAYFESFQPIFPLLHKPTFDVSATKDPLLQAIACIGAVYHSVGSNRGVSLALFEYGLKGLDAYVDECRGQRFRETWAMQAYILLEYYAFYSCEDGLFAKGLEIHRKLVDAARQYQMLQDSVTIELNENGLSDDSDRPSSSPSSERAWKNAIQNESRKRVVYFLYYLDAQVAICCNVRPLLTALELKYELPCRDDIWSAPSAASWQALTLLQEGSFNEEDDDEANGDPRPAHGYLYEGLMHLMNRVPPSHALGLLWHSPFLCLMLVVQIQMMTRDLTTASIFLYNNIRCDERKTSLSIISEGNRAQIMQALHALADLMPTPGSPGWPHAPDDDSHSVSTDSSLWSHVWIVWHYSAMCLTHQDALLTSGIVEYSLPTAISTTWELGKPRSKHYRDVYEDRDMMRIASSLENILAFLTRPSMGPGFDTGSASTGRTTYIEDPFMTMIGFKSCLMGWRIVRLMALGLEQSTGFNNLSSRVPSIYAVSAQVVLARILTAIRLPDSHDRPDSIGTGPQDVNPAQGETFSDPEAQYLGWAESTFATKNLWPPGGWVVAVFNENRHEM